MLYNHQADSDDEYIERDPLIIAKHDFEKQFKEIKHNTQKKIKGIHKQATDQEEHKEHEAQLIE